MSLTSYVQDRKSIIWQMLKSTGGDVRLQEFCNSIKLPVTKFKLTAAINEAPMVGMAMRYVLMHTFGDQYLKNNPVSLSYSETFDDVLDSFGSNESHGFIAIATLDHKLRSGAYQDEFQNKILESASSRKHRGLRSFPKELTDSQRFKVLDLDVKNLTESIRNHLNKENVRWSQTTCLHCGTTQVPQRGKSWSCTQCGAPLVYEPIKHSSVTLATRPRWDKKSNLIPTYAAHIGGADAPVAIGYQQFSVRSVSRPIVTPEHILMAFGWWTLWSEEDCPPWESATIIYPRQEAEVTFEFQSLMNYLQFDIEEFHSELEDNYHNYRSLDWDWDTEIF